MTREIKFRVWDKWNKQYFENLNNIFITGNGEIGIVDKYGHNLIEEYQERFVSEFSTDINDKNGVEIYENDIVIATPMVPGDEQDTDAVPTGVVKYDEGAYFIFGSNNAIRLFQETIQISVVGNVHQNPELLGGI